MAVSYIHRLSDGPLRARLNASGPRVASYSTGEQLEEACTAGGLFIETDFSLLKKTQARGSNFRPESMAVLF
jgi:hypothetical protein